MKRANIKKLEKAILLVAISIISINSSGQSFSPYNEVGLMLGSSYYLGELNKTHLGNQKTL